MIIFHVQNSFFNILWCLCQLWILTTETKATVFHLLHRFQLNSFLLKNVTVLELFNIRVLCRCGLACKILIQWYWATTSRCSFRWWRLYLFLNSLSFAMPDFIEMCLYWPINIRKLRVHVACFRPMLISISFIFLIHFLKAFAEVYLHMLDLV